MSVVKYRLKINLEEIFNDVRKSAYILIKSDWKYIKDIKNHIKKLFKLKNINLLIEKDSCYLPVYEQIEVINANDIIKVTRKGTLSSSSSSSSSRSNIKDNNDCLTEITCIPSFPKNLNNNNNHSDEKISIKKNRKKNKLKNDNISLNDNYSIGVNNFDEKIEQDNSTIRTNNNYISTNTRNISSRELLFVNNNNNCDTIGTDENDDGNGNIKICLKNELKNNFDNNISDKFDNTTVTDLTKTNKKRKRKRKNQSLINASSSSSSTTLSAKCFITNENIKNNSIIQNQQIKNNNRNNNKKNHILKFDDDGNVIKNTKIIFKNYLNDLPLTPRIINGIPIEKKNDNVTINNNENHLIINPIINNTNKKLSYINLNLNNLILISDTDCIESDSNNSNNKIKNVKIKEKIINEHEKNYKQIHHHHHNNDYNVIEENKSTEELIITDAASASATAITSIINATNIIPIPITKTIIIETTDNINKESLIPIDNNAAKDSPINIDEYVKFSKPLDYHKPGIDDILLFKIRLKDENYDFQPILSDYICGKVKYFDHSADETKMHIIEGQDQFKLSTLSTTPKLNEDDIVDLDLYDMYDTRILEY